MNQIESRHDRIARTMRRITRNRRLSKMADKDVPRRTGLGRTSKVWPSERRMFLPKPPAWVADRDLWEKISKKIGGYGRGYGWSLTEATRVYREEGGAIRRSPARFDEYKKASRSPERFGRFGGSYIPRRRRATIGGIPSFYLVLDELNSIGGPEEIADELNIEIETAECIFEAIATIPQARIERAQRKYEKRMKGE